MSKFGELLKQYRLEAELSLREFCQIHGFDAGNHSKLERGRFAPPENEDRVTLYAEALGIAPGSDKWMTLFDAAAAERGRIPSDIMANEDIVDKLPVLFRTIRSEQQSGNIDLDDLIERIKRS
ncbi:MAG: hypothetical protein COA78_23970 [Blastopirellula sp.]|nr:MAG: hypothetical protein COA78_23970 [Blastopirellula sp.]